MDIRRSAMSDSALSERRRPAAVEDPAPSKAMKAAAGKTWRSRRADVDPSRASAKAMKAAGGKTW
jgi:hypothetical protein